MYEPLVSIIIPMYNSKEWIERLFASIHQQSYRNIEVILVNDGSKDISIDEIKTLITKNHELQVTLVDQSNMGVSSARNNGVLHSKGELLAFVDSDDVWAPTKIENQVKTLRQQCVDAVSCSYVIFRDSSDKIVQIVNPDWSTKGVHDWLMMRSYGGLLSSTLLLTRSAFDNTGPFDTELSLSADIEFALRLIELYPVYLLETPLVGYRLRDNQMHHQESLVESESRRILRKVPYFEQTQNTNLFLANLNLRLALYQFAEFKFTGGFRYFSIAIQHNFWECFQTIFKIVSNRWKRRSVKNYKLDSFLIQSSQIQSKQ